jgi:hypothetical protein
VQVSVKPGDAHTARWGGCPHIAYRHMLSKAIHAELQTPVTRKLLSEMTLNRSTSAGRPLTDLHALGIVVWMHKGRRQAPCVRVKSLSTTEQWRCSG